MNDTTQVLAPVDTEETTVIFRRFRNGNKELIAFFPYIIEGSNGYDCMSYMHVGQHSAANYSGLVSVTRAANMSDDDEVKDLTAELTGRGYKLKVAKRVNAALEHKARKEFRNRK